MLVALGIIVSAGEMGHSLNHNHHYLQPLQLNKSKSKPWPWWWTIHYSPLPYPLLNSIISFAEAHSILPTTSDGRSASSILGIRSYAYEIWNSIYRRPSLPAPADVSCVTVIGIEPYTYCYCYWIYLYTAHRRRGWFSVAHSNCIGVYVAA